MKVDFPISFDADRNLQTPHLCLILGLQADLELENGRSLDRLLAFSTLMRERFLVLCAVKITGEHVR